MGPRTLTRRLASLLPLLAVCLVPCVSAQKWNRYGPGTRSQASAIFDASTNQMIMFGGQHAPTSTNFNDTWAVKNVIASGSGVQSNLNWTSVTVTGKPPSNRFGHTAVYNPTSNRMIVFGGGTGFPAPCVNELWVLKNPNSVGSAAWSQLTPTGTVPPARQGHTAIYDATTNTMTVFGGTDCAGNYFNDVWILSNADGASGTPAWAQAQPPGPPPSARTQSTAIYDSANNIMTIFAGGAANKTYFSDVWTLSHANGSGGTPEWAALTPSGTPPTARSGHSSVYDSVNNLMVSYGGIISTGAIRNDSWILTFANGIGGTPAWSQLVPAAAGPFRRSHTVIYDPASNEMVIFGGSSELPQNFTDDHVLILSHANGLP